MKNIYRLLRIMRPHLHAKQPDDTAMRLLREMEDDGIIEEVASGAWRLTEHGADLARGLSE